MTNLEHTDIREALEASPRVLLLGQSLLSVIRPASSLADLIPSGYGEDDFYKWWLATTTIPLEKKCLQTNGLGNALLLDKRFDALRDVPWRCVFTSTIDPTTRRILESHGRRPVQSRFERRDPDMLFLTLYRLFGSVERDSSSEMPPPDQLALRQRRPTAQQILLSLTEAVGPRGHLFIEGWNPTRGDWLRPRDLAPSLFELAPGQVLIFGLDDTDQRALLDDDDFATLIKEGIVRLYCSPLIEFIESLARIEGFRLMDPRLEAPETIVIECRNCTPERIILPHRDDLSRVVLTQPELRHLTETFDILIPLQLSKPMEASEADNARTFRDFLQRSPASQLPRVRQFAFRRPMLDDKVLPLILKLLAMPSPQDHTVVISGQSGVGKTTLLSLLAVDLREAGLPVVLVGQRTVPPNLSHLDEFVQRVEAVSSTATVVIWDGLNEPAEYQKLSQELASLGRKVLVVGSSYTLQSQSTARQRPSPSSQARTYIVDVSVEMVPHERNDLLVHFGRFLPVAAQVLERYDLSKYNNVFAALYYLADPLRPRLVDGLVNEIESAADRLEARVKAHLAEHGHDNSGMSAMEYALRQALGDRFDEMVLQKSSQVNESERASVVRSEGMTLVNAVMLISDLGLDTPQSLALRLLGREKHLAYRSAMEDYPVLTSHETAEGDIYLSARQPLEAQIWCEKRLPDEQNRFQVIYRLATRLEPHEAKNDRSSEFTFVIRLLQTIGPQGAHPMRRRFEEIATIVEELRKKLPSVHSRLLLIEANALREHVQQTQRDLTQSETRGATVDVLKSLEKGEELLERAEHSLIEAEKMVWGDSEVALSVGARRMISVLATERAAVVGARLWCLLSQLKQESHPLPIVFIRTRKALDDARRTWRRALTIDDENIQALDTACWILRDYLNSGIATEAEEMDVLADWSDIIEQYGQVDMTPDQLEKFDERERQLAQRLKDTTRFRAILERSAERGGNAVHLLMARHIRETQSAAFASEYLESNCSSALYSDRLLLLFYYRLWWEIHSHFSEFFPRDHLCLAFDVKEWESLDRLATARLSLDGEAENRLALFHHGWAALQLGHGRQAVRVFEQLETVSIGSYRRGRTLVLVSDELGKPKQFYGETRATSFSHIGRVWLDELRLEIPFKTIDFKDIERRAGQPMGPFHIAVNYRGAFAQPTFRA